MESHANRQACSGSHEEPCVWNVMSARTFALDNLGIENILGPNWLKNEKDTCSIIASSATFCMLVKHHSNLDVVGKLTISPWSIEASKYVIAFS
jgi:hypothetical protein